MLVTRRVEIAFLVQPLVCAALGFLLFPLVAFTAAGGGHTIDVAEGAIGFGIVTGLVAVPITGIAASAFGWLTKDMTLSATRTMLFGVMFGNIVPAVAILGTALLRGLSALPGAILGSARASIFGTVVGALSGAAFWLMIDNDEP